jgi:hypothetical protein
MSFPARYTVVSVASTTLNGTTAGSTVGGTATQTSELALDTLSCKFTVNAKTNTMTITGKWQVSDDNSTWVDMPPENNAAIVALATGDGVGVAATKALPAPRGVLGWKWVRPAILVGVVDSAQALDTYALDIHYRRFNGFG